MENHKGKWCIYKPTVFCQEGYCSGCQIYLDFKASLKEGGSQDGVDTEPGQSNQE